MSDQMKRRVRLGYAIFVSLLLALTALLFVISCIGIYRSGDSPFTRESVGTAIRAIIVPIVLTVACAIGGGILHVCMPPPAEKLRAPKDADATLRRLSKRLPRSLPVDTAASILAERKRRCVLWLLLWVYFLLCAVYPAFYVLNSANFVGEALNAEIGIASLLLLSFALLFTVGALAFAWLRRRSFMREADAVKAFLAAPVTGADEMPSSQTSSSASLTAFLRKNADKCRLALRIFVLLLAVLFILLGILNGGMADVVKKAIKICTECIGMG